MDILKASENCTLSFDVGDIKISIVKGNISAPAAEVLVAAAPVVAAAVAGAPAPDPNPNLAAESAAAVATDDVDEAGLDPITADITSVFYRRPSPDEAPYVKVGDEVLENTCVCLLEVMKCFRQVMANVKGRIIKILVDTGDLVEAGTVMFLVKPI